MSRFQEHLAAQLDEIRSAGLWKAERVIQTPQSSRIGVPDDRKVLNLCANNYLGLADHPEILAAAKEGLDRWGLRDGLGEIYLRNAVGSSAARREAQRISAHTMTRFFTHRASTQTAVCLRRFLQTKTRSFPTPSTMRASSTVCGFAKRSGFATPTTIWQTWKRS